jgi:N-acetylmuramoyl-L-alanine amidase
MNVIRKACSPRNFMPGRPGGLRPAAIVIHISEGTLASADAWFSNDAAKVSAHYCVGRSGEVHQYVSEEDTAYHAGTPVNPTWRLLRPRVNPNFYTIGIEHEGRAQDQWPDPQYATSAELVAEIARRWSIPIDADHIVMHREIRGNKTCPGYIFSRKKLLSLIPPAVPAESGKTVMVITQANLRADQPNRSSGIRAVLNQGTSVPIASVAVGESVDGNATWYCLQDGGFLWAGATDAPNPAT